MDPIEVRVNDIFVELSDENKRLNRLVNVLTDFKVLCDSIVDYLDYDLSSDIYNTYLDLTQKYKQCNNEDEEEEEELQIRVKTEVLDENESLIGLTAGQTTGDNNQEVNAQKSNEDSNSGRDVTQEVLADHSQLNDSQQPSTSKSGIDDKKLELDKQYPEESNNILDLIELSSDSSSTSDVELMDVDDDDEEYIPGQSSRGRKSKRRPSVPTDASKRLKCELKGCEHLYFRSNFHLNRHKSSHSLDKPFQCSISDCLNRYKRSDHLIRHILVCHPIEYQKNRSDQPIKCDNCNKKFKYKRTLDSHDCPKHWTHQSHSVQSTINWCDICSQLFINEKALEEHKANHNFGGEQSTDRSPERSSPEVSPTKRKISPFFAFARDMRPVVLNAMKKELAEEGSSPTMEQIDRELDKQWHRLRAEHKNIFVEMCKD